MKASNIEKELSDRYNTVSDVAAFTLSRKQSKKQRRSSFMSAVSKAHADHKQEQVAHA